jgi:hypothetical protein
MIAVVRSASASVVNFAIVIGDVEILFVTIVVWVPVFGKSSNAPVGSVNGTVCVTLALSR